MPRKKGSTPFLPILIIITVIIGGLLFLFKPQEETPVTPASPDSVDTPKLSIKKNGPSEEPASPKVDSPPLQEEEAEPLFRKAPMEADLTNPCLEAIGKLDLFFSYLDEQQYIQKYQLPADSKETISNLFNSLLASPPNNKGEAQGNNTIRNAAHIYRKLGAQNLTFLLKIIENEGDVMEETCGYFYTWIKISPQCLNHSYPLRPGLDDLYEYAVFFMDTTGGQAYLNRRQDNLKLLAQYYSILIIHEADQQGLNKYDIDLLPLLINVLNSMENSEELAEKKSYLNKLYDIRQQQVTTHLQ